jgi:hypothetical protein
VDAIIVPSARRAAALTEAGRLAEELGCALLVLCSKHSDPQRVAESLARRTKIDAIAIDFPEAGVGKLPELETSTVLGESRLKRRTDTSAKRNLGLVLAWLAGWKRVVFLDDDIAVPDAADLERAAALLDTRDGVGLHIGGFPDNSVVCHANRETGAQQDTFIGGGALAVPSDRIDSFFPEVYNEDWFFLLGKTMLRPVGQVGEAIQKPYDPFASPERARREEFGDVLAEGLFALFDDSGRIGDADEAYWTRFLAARLALIEEIKGRIEHRGPVTVRDKQMLESLTASSGRLQFIRPQQCVGYLRAWQRDRERWRAFMAELRRRSCPRRPTVSRRSRSRSTPPGNTQQMPTPQPSAPTKAHESAVVSTTRPMLTPAMIAGANHPDRSRRT